MEKQTNEFGAKLPKKVDKRSVAAGIMEICFDVQIEISFM
jgi:hypothetical protein